MALTVAPPIRHTVVEKSFDDARRLLVSLPFAAVTLRGGEDKRLRVRVQMDGKDLPTARRLNERLRLHVRAHEEAVKIETPPLSPQLFTEWESSDQPPVSVEIDVPACVQVDASVVSGTLDAAGLEGHIVLECKGGTLRASNLRGRLEMIGLGSTMLLDNLEGASLILRSAGGSLKAEGLGAERQELHLTAVNARLSRIDSPSTLHLHNSDLSINQLAAALNGEMHAGRLKIKKKEPVPVQIRNVSGIFDVGE